MVPSKRSSEAREPRRFDKTALTHKSHGEFVHRDYLAHCLRWGWAAKMIKLGQSVLDVGCGVEAPLAVVLSNTNFVHGGQYVGVDMNRKIRQGGGRGWCRVIPEFDFTARYKELGLFDIVTNFEVIEHMPKTDGPVLLRAMRECLKPGGRLLLSTPVFNGKAARNHTGPEGPREYTVRELQEAIESSGLRVVERRGTFASYHPIKKVLTPAHLEVYEELREFFGDDLMACFLAPLYPDASRNCFWVLERTTGGAGA